MYLNFNIANILIMNRREIAVTNITAFIVSAFNAHMGLSINMTPQIYKPICKWSLIIALFSNLYFPNFLHLLNHSIWEIKKNPKAYSKKVKLGAILKWMFVVDFCTQIFTHLAFFQFKSFFCIYQFSKKKAKTRINIILLRVYW